MGKRKIIAGIVGTTSAVLITTLVTVGFFETGPLQILKNSAIAAFAFLITYTALVKAYRIYEHMYRQSL